jgi:hypothetical protein
MANWRDEYFAALVVRDRRDQANTTLFDACMQKTHRSSVLHHLIIIYNKCQLPNNPPLGENRYPASRSFCASSPTRNPSNSILSGAVQKRTRTRTRPARSGPVAARHPRSGAIRPNCCPAVTHRAARPLVAHDHGPGETEEEKHPRWAADSGARGGTDAPAAAPERSG